jgi:imidazolonepropionase-like amidohydrolase
MVVLLSVLGPSIRAQETAPVEASPPTGAVTVVHAGKLLAVPGTPTLDRQTIVIRDGRVDAVLDGFVEVPDLGLAGDVEVIDLSDSFVLPGLTDLHTHVTMELGPEVKLAAVTLAPVDHALNAVVFLERTLAAGFTTIRNVGADPRVIFPLRRGVDAGKIVGPRIVAAGAGVANTGGHADSHGYLEEILELFQSSGICDGGEDCRRAVRAQVKRGSDWIKITATGGVLSETAAGVNQQLFDDELEAIVATARMMDREVAAHAHGTDGINAALRAGVRTIEHGTFADEESFALFRERGAFLVPTMLAGFTVAEVARQSDFMPAPIRVKALEVGPQMAEMVSRAHASGVRIAFGTDSGVSPHGQNAREFALLVSAGMSEMEAIESATVTAAEVLGLSADLGSIEPGKRADLIATPGSPLNDIEALMNVIFVMKDGVVFKHEATSLRTDLPPRGSR